MPQGFLSGAAKQVRWRRSRTGRGAKLIAAAGARGAEDHGAKKGDETRFCQTARLSLLTGWVVCYYCAMYLLLSLLLLCITAASTTIYTTAF